MNSPAQRRELPHPPERVRAELQRRILSLLPALGIDAQPRGGMVTPLNPTRNDRTPGSFVIWTTPDAAGAWRDYACGEADRGDVFDLIKYLARLARWIDAYWWALEFLGWGRGEVRVQAVDEAARARAERDRRAAEARAQAEEDAQGRRSKLFWLRCAEDIRGTTAWTYLTGARGLPLEQLKKPPGAIRFAPQLEHLDRATGEITEWPAMVTAMSRWSDGAVRAVHRTFLAPDGTGKAPVATAKMMLGPARGCAIRLWKGETGLTPEKAAAAGKGSPLIITEGIEDGLTAAIAQPAYRVWAAGSLAGLRGLGWPDCASAVVLVADNDWEKPSAVAAFEACLAHWREMARGRPLKVVRAEVGKDLNDWARGVG